MAKWANDSIVLDAPLDALSGATGVTLHVNTAQPANRAAAISDSLATASLSGDFTKADGDTSGRKTTVAAHTGVSITASGTATHVSIISDTDLLYVTTCSSTALSSGGTLSTGAWDIEFADPS